MCLFSGVCILFFWKPIVLLPTLALFMLPLFFMSLEKFRNNVFTLPLMVFLMMYIFIPLTFISYLGVNYSFGWGLNHGIPFTQEYMADHYVENLFFLFVCLLAVMATLALNRTKYIPLKIQDNLNNFPHWTIILLGLMVSSVLANDIATTLAARTDGSAGPEEGLIKFLFFDHAYLFLAGISIFQLHKETTGKQEKGRINTLIFIALLFIGLGFYAGSKASFLGVFWFFFLVAYCFIRNNRNATVLFPSIRVFLIVAAFSPIIYFVVFFYRISMTSSLEFNLSTIVQIFSVVDLDAASLLVDEIFYRLSAGGFDRCMLLFTAFSSSLVPEYGTQQFLPYLLKNLVNLLLPGTPFTEAYAPSSQLFWQVMNSRPLDGDVSANYLLASINSQAYTIFGVMTVIGGWLAPLLLVGYNLFFCIAYNLFYSFFIRITLIYLYMVTLSSFGFEVGFGYAFHVFICFIFMYYFLAGLSKFKI
jgi:hypothetical protein